MGSLTHSRDTEAALRQTTSAQELLWQGDLVAGVQCNDTNSMSLYFSCSHHLKTQMRQAEDSPSVVLLLFLLTNAKDPALFSSEPSTELLLITLSSSFFPVMSPTVPAEASSSSSSSWSEYWLRASTNSLNISSLMNPPSGTQSRCHTDSYHQLNVWFLTFFIKKAKSLFGFKKCRIIENQNSVVLCYPFYPIHITVWLVKYEKDANLKIAKFQLNTYWRFLDQHIRQYSPPQSKTIRGKNWRITSNSTSRVSKIFKENHWQYALKLFCRYEVTHYLTKTLDAAFPLICLLFAGTYNIQHKPLSPWTPS